MAQIAIIGCGSIGSAFTSLWSQSHSVRVFNRRHEKAEHLKSLYPIEIGKDLAQTMKGAEYVLLGFKPQNLADIGPEIAHLLPKKTIVISPLAGTSLETLRIHFNDNPILRIMPNIAIAHQEGVIGMVEDEELKAFKPQIEILMSPFGLLHWIPENKTDALAALIGSTPAFLFSIIEAMVDAGIAMGLSAHESQTLLLQTWQGSIETMRKTKMSPGELKWKVCSPGGMTIAGIRELERKNVRSAMIESILKSYEKIKAM